MLVVQEAKCFGGAMKWNTISLAAITQATRVVRVECRPVGARVCNW